MTDYICIDCGAPFDPSNGSWRCEGPEKTPDGYKHIWTHQCSIPQAGHIGRRGPKPNKEQPNEETGDSTSSAARSE